MSHPSRHYTTRRTYTKNLLLTSHNRNVSFQRGTEPKQRRQEDLVDFGWIQAHCTAFPLTANHHAAALSLRSPTRWNAIAVTSISTLTPIPLDGPTVRAHRQGSPPEPVRYSGRYPADTVFNIPSIPWGVHSRRARRGGIWTGRGGVRWRM